ARIAEIAVLGLQEVQIPQLGAITFPDAPLDPVFCKINADAKGLRVGRREGREKVAMAAPNLPNERSGYQPRERLLQSAAATGNAAKVLASSIKVFHVNVPYSVRWSRSAATATIKILISAGLTPLMRLAWPSVIGCI